MATATAVFSDLKGQEGETRVLPIGGRQGIRGWALVDAEDFERLSRRRWSFTGWGYVRSGGQRQVSLHREVMGLQRGDRRDVDHANGIRTDCRKANLRVLTRGQNLQNQRGRGSSCYRGVSWNKRRGRWVAQHTLDYKQHFIGYFDTELEAHEAAVAWRQVHMPWSDEHGEGHGERPSPRKVAPPAPKQEDAPRPPLDGTARALPVRDQHGTVVGWAVVDADDFEWASNVRWSFVSGYVAGRRNGRDKTYLHREVKGLRPGDGRYVDHINRDKADCRKSNLRVCSTAQVNCQNVPARGGSSAHRGVSFHKASGRWRVRVGPHDLGLFKTEQEAAEAATAFRKQHWPNSND